MKKLFEAINEEDLLEIEELMNRESSDEDMENMLEEAELFEDEDPDAISDDEVMTEEELKIESLKIATNIAKLMSDVTPDDILSIANTVSDFIRNHEIGGDNSTEETSTEDIDEPINFDIDTEEGEEEYPEEYLREKNQRFKG